MGILLVAEEPVLVVSIVDNDIQDLSYADAWVSVLPQVFVAAWMLMPKSDAD